SAIRKHLVNALDDWLFGRFTHMRWYSSKQDPNFLASAKVYEHLRAVADLADPDEWRRRVRDPEVHKDPRALVELAGRPEIARLPASTTVLLARVLLYSQEEMDKSLALLLAVQQRSPDEFFIHYELALVLSWMKPARLEEAIGFMRAAVALRPHNPV